MRSANVDRLVHATSFVGGQYATRIRHGVRDHSPSIELESSSISGGVRGREVVAPEASGDQRASKDDAIFAVSGPLRRDSCEFKGESVSVAGTGRVDPLRPFDDRGSATSVVTHPDRIHFESARTIIDQLEVGAAPSFVVGQQ